MTLLEQFIQAYKEGSEVIQPTFDENLLGLLDLCRYTLSNEKFLPSKELKESLEGLRQRALEPMKVAIIGQFSAGKSTFLNAILSKPILPTGITPVTSKICHLRYGEEFSLEVILEDGRTEFHKIENLKTIEEDHTRKIKQLTVYAPVELLKEVTFLDTPGFNSQNERDTKVTSEVLEEVDGIIWLTLIDNAGKQSELEILQNHLSKYATKSLCVLNQKDKFDSPEEIENTVSYVKNRFGEFFAEVIPVSSKLALQAKGFDKGEIAQEELWQLSRELIQLSSTKEFNKEKILGLIMEHERRVEGFCVEDSQKAMRLYEESNFKPVLSFIHHSIRPQALSAKEFALKRELLKTIEILRIQYENFHGIYEKLEGVFKSYEENLESSLRELKNSHRQELHLIAQDIRYHLENIAEILFRHIRKEDRLHLSKRSKALFGIASIHQRTLLVARLDKDRINEELFLGDSKNVRFFKALQFKIRRAAEKMESSFEGLLRHLEQEIKLWQEPYELARKRHPLGSDSAHSNLRKFAAKSYEMLLKDFTKHQHEMATFVHAELGALLALFSGAHEKMLELAILRLEERMESSILRHLNNPADFSIYHPSLDEIRTLLEESFALHTYLPKIEGEGTVADRAYQKMFAGSHQLLEEKHTIIKERLTTMQERLATLESLKEKILSTAKNGG